LDRTAVRGSQVFSRHTPEEMAQEPAFKLISLVDQEPQRMFLHPRTRKTRRDQTLYLGT